MATLPAIINSVGLLLDIVGVCLIYRYGIPLLEHLRQSGMAIWDFRSLGDKDADAYEAKGRRQRLLSLTGLGLIVAGFGLQIVSNWIACCG